MATVTVTKDNFEAEVLRSDKPVLVDFWADWCGPCKMLAPTIEELAQKYDGRVKVCKVDVDAEPDLAKRFGVMSIPTIIAFSDGEPKSKSIGVQPIEVLENMLR